MLDQAAAAILSQLLNRKGIAASFAGPDSSTTRGLFTLDATGADVTLSCLFDHRSIAPICYSVRRLRKNFLSIPIVVCLWGAGNVAAMSELDWRRRRGSRASRGGGFSRRWRACRARRTNCDRTGRIGPIFANAYCAFFQVAFPSFGLACALRRLCGDRTPGPSRSVGGQVARPNLSSLHASTTQTRGLSRTSPLSSGGDLAGQVGRAETPSPQERARLLRDRPGRAEGRRPPCVAASRAGMASSSAGAERRRASLAGQSRRRRPRKRARVSATR